MGVRTLALAITDLYSYYLSQLSLSACYQDITVVKAIRDITVIKAIMEITVFVTVRKCILKECPAGVAVLNCSRGEFLAALYSEACGPDRRQAQKLALRPVSDHFFP
jgi:hypothetical protein